MQFTIRVTTLLLAAMAMLFAQEPSQAEKRAANLKQRLMAPCCWQESLARHESPLANELKAEIRQAIAAGKSDAQIEAAFIQRFGRRILVEPEGVQGRILTIVPVLVLVFGAIWVGWLLRRWARPVCSASP
jgi:cytochrome c-type biogenesis protein CcmH